MLKKNKVYLGDCLELMKNIPDKSIDMILCDLPYFKVVKDEWDNQWKTQEQYLCWIENIILEYNRIIKNNSNILLFCSRQNCRHIQLILDKYFTEQRQIIWSRKRSFNTTRGKTLNSGYEPILWYSSGDYKFNNIKIKVESNRKEYNTGILKDGISISDVWNDIPALPHNSKEKLKHPTQKPVKLIERCINIFSNEGDLILDNCAGVMTTHEACFNTKRNSICIEKDENYYNIGVNRIERLK